MNTEYEKGRAYENRRLIDLLQLADVIREVPAENGMPSEWVACMLSDSAPQNPTTIEGLVRK